MKISGKLLSSLLVPLAVGGVGGFATASSVNNWYSKLRKPSFNPPNYVFGPVWTALYIMMGISFYMILESPKNEYYKGAVYSYCFQLFLNFWWSLLFFKFKMLTVSFIEIILLWMSVATMVFLFYKVNKLAALLQIPYLLWVSFASFLNGSVWNLNKDNLSLSN